LRKITILIEMMSMAVKGLKNLKRSNIEALKKVLGECEK